LKNSDSQHLITRRHFIGSMLMATTAGSILYACKTSPWQIGIYTRPWNNVDYLVAFDSIAEAGFSYIGLMSHKGGRIIGQETPIEDAYAIGEQAVSRGLKVTSISGHSFDKNKSVDDGITELKRLIDNSAACNCPNIMLNGVSAPELVDKYYKVIAESCDYAAEKNVIITLKPHGGTNSSGAECRMRIENVGHKNFKLWYDPGNIYFYSNGEINPVDDIVDVADILTGMCIKDFRMPRDVNVTPGTGMVDFPVLFTRMREGGFKKGPLMIETLDTGDNAFLISEARKAREYIEGLI
jgi:sugar phosphate isomerase/epimerase